MKYFIFFSLIAGFACANQEKNQDLSLMEALNKFYQKEEVQSSATSNLNNNSQKEEKTSDQELQNITKNLDEPESSNKTPITLEGE